MSDTVFKYAVIREVDDVVKNIILFDESNPIIIPDCYFVKLLEGTVVDVGYIYNTHDGSFSSF